MALRIADRLARLEGRRIPVAESWNDPRWKQAVADLEARARAKASRAIGVVRVMEDGSHALI